MGANINKGEVKNKPVEESKIWGIAVFWALISCAAADGAGFWYFLFCVPVSFGAYKIGDSFRRFTAPDYFVTKDVWDTFFKKMFWRIGPQVIAMIIGSMILYGIMFE